MLAGGEVGRFHDPARPYLHPEDVDIALDIDRYDFAVRVDLDERPLARMESLTPTAENPSRWPLIGDRNVPHGFAGITAVPAGRSPITLTRLTLSTRR